MRGHGQKIGRKKEQANENGFLHGFFIRFWFRLLHDEGSAGMVAFRTQPVHPLLHLNGKNDLNLKIWI